MKTFYKNILSVSLLLLGLFVVSCESDVYDIEGDTQNKLYFATPGNTVNSYYRTSFTITKTPLAVAGDVQFKYPISVWKKAVGEIKASVKIDNSLVVEYNDQYSSEYKELDATFLDVNHNQVIIPNDSLVSSDSISISLNEERKLELKGGEYLVPVVISSVEGDARISNRNVTYLVIKIDEDADNINDGAMVLDMDRLETDRSALWSMEISPAPASTRGDMPNFFNGIADSYTSRFTVSITAKTTFIIDMKEVQTDIKGLFINGLISKSELSYSNDNQNWTELGTTSRGISSVVFYKPIDARYIKWVAPYVKPNWSNSVTLNLTEFDLYK